MAFLQITRHFVCRRVGGDANDRNLLRASRRSETIRCTDYRTTAQKQTRSGQADRPISITQNQSLPTRLTVGFLGSLRPERVAQVEFLEWTSGDRLRHARFVGLREEKEPREVVKEHAGESASTRVE